MKNLLDTLLLKAASTQNCPLCGNKFGPGARLERRANGHVIEIICGSCGKSTDMSSLRQGGQPVPEEDCPDDPAPEPPAAKLRHFRTADGAFGMDIPRSGKSGCLLPFALVWLGFCSFIFLAPVLMENKPEGETPGPLFFGIFAAVFLAAGVGLLIAAIRMKYTRHRLFVSRDRLLYQSELFGRRKTIQMACDAVADLGQKVFYTQNYQPVRGIEIRDSGGKTIRFGAHLDPDVKRWMVFQLREELRARGNRILTPRRSPASPKSAKSSDPS